LGFGQVGVDTIWVDEVEMAVARSGDNVKMKLKGTKSHTWLCATGGR
jgi:hypothetical protein